MRRRLEPRKGSFLERNRLVIIIIIIIIIATGLESDTLQILHVVKLIVAWCGGVVVKRADTGS